MGEDVEVKQEAVDQVGAEDREVEVVLAVKRGTKHQKGDLEIIQQRAGLFVIVEYNEKNEPMIKFPKIMTLCQLCNNKNCKNYSNSSKRFAKCTIRTPLKASELTDKFRELVASYVKESHGITETVPAEEIQNG